MKLCISPEHELPHELPCECCVACDPMHVTDFITIEADFQEAERRVLTAAG